MDGLGFGWADGGEERRNWMDLVDRYMNETYLMGLNWWRCSTVAMACAIYVLCCMA
jgi:hypothetical protein